MKKGLIVVIVVVAILVIIVAAGVGGYNSLVGLRESVDSQAANIQTQLQRRSDLIPNLVSTVKGYAAHEEDIFTAIADARAKLAGAGSDMGALASADAELTSALSRLLVVVENYPNLKADTQFTALMDELAGTENRIAVARKDFNDTARDYNTRIKQFPTVFFANIFGFGPAAYFEADEAAQQAPIVSFK